MPKNVKNITITYDNLPLSDYVRDRENQPIFFGDELYYINDKRNHRYKITKIQVGIDGEIRVFIINIDGSFIPGWVSPLELTHIKPLKDIEEIIEECKIYLAECDISWVEDHIREAYFLGKQEGVNA